MVNVNGVTPASGPENTHEGHSSSPAGSAGGAFSVAMQSAQSRRSIASPVSPNQAPATAHAGNGGHDFYERALNVLSYRLQMIASNIANADTPNYKAVDIDFREALRQGAGKTADAASSNASHATGAAVEPSSRIPLKYHVPQQGNVDGNTVEMEAERAKFADTAIRYQFSLDRVKGHYMMMEDLLKNLKD